MYRKWQKTINDKQNMTIEATINFHVICSKCGNKHTPTQDLEIKKEDWKGREIMHVTFQAFPCESCITEIAENIARESLTTINEFKDKLCNDKPAKA